MTENNLRELFSTVVAAPPPDTTDIDAAIRVGHRQRQRRTVAMALSAAAVVAVAVAVAGINVAGSRPPAASVLSPVSAGRTVTDAHQLLGTWQATDLDGKDVRGVIGFESQPLNVTFSSFDKQWIWSANSAGAGHAYSGVLSVTAQGKFDAGQRVGVTLNGHVGKEREDTANPDAVRHATEARIVPATPTGAARLLLLDGGRVLGVYVKVPTGLSAAPSPAATPYMIDGTLATDPGLDDIAQALGDQGRGAFADTFSDIYVDEPPGAVTLYVTDIARGRQLVDAAKNAHPKIDTGRIRLIVAKFSRRTLDTAIEKIMPATGADPAIYSASPKTDGSGITVTAAKGQVAAVQSRLNREIVIPMGIPVTVVAGQPAKPADAVGTAPAK